MYRYVLPSNCIAIKLIILGDKLVSDLFKLFQWLSQRCFLISFNTYFKGFFVQNQKNSKFSSRSQSLIFLNIKTETMYYE